MLENKIKTILNISVELKEKVKIAEKRYLIEALIIMYTPIAHELDTNYSTKKIDEKYMNDVAKKTRDRLSLITEDNIDEKINKYFEFLNNGIPDTYHFRKGHKDLFRLVLSGCRKGITKKRLIKIGKTFEQSLPSRYKAFGYGNGKNINPNHMNKVFNIEYLTLTYLFN